MNLSDNHKKGIRNLKLESVALMVDYNDKTKEKFLSLMTYKFPIKNIVLMEEVYVGQESSPTIMFEIKDGIVYSFSTDQTGASVSSFFDNNGNLNIKEEKEFKNIIKFVNYKLSDGRTEYSDYYAIDINGKVIYR